MLVRPCLRFSVHSFSSRRRLFALFEGGSIATPCPFLSCIFFFRLLLVVMVAVLLLWVLVLLLVLLLEDLARCSHDLFQLASLALFFPASVLALSTFMIW